MLLNRAKKQRQNLQKFFLPKTARRLKVFFFFSESLSTHYYFFYGPNYRIVPFLLSGGQCRNVGKRKEEQKPQKNKDDALVMLVCLFLFFGGSSLSFYDQLSVIFTRKTAVYGERQAIHTTSLFFLLFPLTT